MQDMTAVDATLDAGYYQGHSEALPLIVLAIALLVALGTASQSKGPLAISRNQQHVPSATQLVAVLRDLLQRPIGLRT